MPWSITFVPAKALEECLGDIEKVAEGYFEERGVVICRKKTYRNDLGRLVLYYVVKYWKREYLDGLYKRLWSRFGRHVFVWVKYRKRV